MLQYINGDRYKVTADRGVILPMALHGQIPRQHAQFREMDISSGDEPLRKQLLHPDVAALYLDERERHSWKNGPPEIRHNHFTATDLDPIRGKSPWSTRNTIFAKKLRVGPERKTTYAMSRGVTLEPMALRIYAYLTGRALVAVELGYIFTKLESGCVVGASLDGVTAYYPINVEIKNPLSLQLKHQVPERYKGQLQQQMFVSGLRVSHFVQFKPPTMALPGCIDICRVDFDPQWWLKVATPLLEGSWARLAILREMDREELAGILNLRIETSRAKTKPRPRRKINDMPDLI